MTTVKINLTNNVVTQYSYPPFVSFCMFQGRPLAAGADGIFTLDGNKKDIYTAENDERFVNGWFELPVSTFAQPLIKQGRRLYIGGEFDGLMTITTNTNCKTVRAVEYIVTPRNYSMVNHVLEVPLGYRQRSEYWGFIVANVRGADFSIDFIDGVFIPVVRRLGL